MIPRTVLIAPEPFGAELSAARAAAAIGRGLAAGDPPWEVDLCPLEDDGPDDARLRAARAVIVGGARLDERTLLTEHGAPSATFELATRARQAGVPAYAVTARNALSAFDARIMDLQEILEARDTRALRRAGERLARLL